MSNTPKLFGRAADEVDADGGGYYWEGPASRQSVLRYGDGSWWAPGNPGVFASPHAAATALEARLRRLRDELTAWIGDGK